MQDWDIRVFLFKKKKKKITRDRDIRVFLSFGFPAFVFKVEENLFSWSNFDRSWPLLTVSRREFDPKSMILHGRWPEEGGDRPAEVKYIGKCFGGKKNGRKWEVTGDRRWPFVEVWLYYVNEVILELKTVAAQIFLLVNLVWKIPTNLVGPFELSALLYVEKSPPNLEDFQLTQMVVKFCRSFISDTVGSLSISPGF